MQATAVPSTTANPFDEIVSDLMEPLEGVADAMVETVQEFISINVERQGGRVIRSAPGEHPRKDTGRLYESIQYEIERDESIITITIDTDTPYAPFLEFGTSKMAERPIFEGIMERFEPILLDTAAQVIGGE